ncbi:DUF968 domain-containing protein [Levilactobacillus brevis]|nr:DUF968 domain-containing protein [Levilactobacillus brevis]
MKRVPAELKGRDLILHLDHELNSDHLETVSGSHNHFWVDFEVADTRKARSKQRRLFFALLNDISIDCVVPAEFLKSLFYTQFQIYTGGRQISLAEATESSVSDAKQLIDLVIDFMFEWHVPFKEGYELLPRDEEYFLYQCCRHRRCMICGRSADIHHLDAVGMGMDRRQVDHSKRHVMALCRKHHGEFHMIGASKFSSKYHVPVEGLKLDVETLRRIGVPGNYGGDQNGTASNV